MRRAPIEEIKPGDRVARTLYFSHGTVMAPAGARLDAGAIAKLKDFGYASLYIYDEETEDLVIHDYLDERSRLKITRHVTSLFNDLKEEAKKSIDPVEFGTSSAQDLRARIESPKFRQILSRANISETFMGDVETIMESILSDREISLCVGTIKTSHNFIFDHSLEVAIHSALIARRFDFTRAEIKEIVLGSLLHDIGQILLPEDLLKKNSPLTPQEEGVLRQHSVLGYYLLKERSDVSLLAAHVAYQHHEHQDGTGYPRGLRGTNRILARKEALAEETGMIHRYAAVVAVPDYYDELTSPLPYRPAFPPEVAIEHLRAASGTALNAAVVDAFISYLPVFPLGTTVVCQNGEFAGWRGVVVQIHPSDLARPVVRFLNDRKKKLPEPVDIDLRENASLTLKTVWK